MCQARARTSWPLPRAGDTSPPLTGSVERKSWRSCGLSCPPPRETQQRGLLTLLPPPQAAQGPGQSGCEPKYMGHFICVQGRCEGVALPCACIEYRHIKKVSRTDVSRTDASHTDVSCADVSLTPVQMCHVYMRTEQIGIVQMCPVHESCTNVSCPDVSCPDVPVQICAIQMCLYRCVLYTFMPYREACCTDACMPSPRVWV